MEWTQSHLVFEDITRNFLLSYCDMTAFHHDVQVVEGYEVVKAVEACGSRSGETAFDVMIADCGQLPKGEFDQHQHCRSQL